MLPSHQDLAINHATVSAPSSGSCTIGWNTPSDLNVPRSPGTPLRTRPYGKDLPALLTYGTNPNVLERDIRIRGALRILADRLHGWRAVLEVIEVRAPPGGRRGGWAISPPPASTRTPRAARWPPPRPRRRASAPRCTGG